MSLQFSHFISTSKKTRYSPPVASAASEISERMFHMSSGWYSILHIAKPWFAQLTPVNRAPIHARVSVRLVFLSVATAWGYEPGLSDSTEGGDWWSIWGDCQKKYRHVVEMAKATMTINHRGRAASACITSLPACWSALCVVFHLLREHNNIPNASPVAMSRSFGAAAAARQPGSGHDSRDLRASIVGPQTIPTRLRLPGFPTLVWYAEVLLPQQLAST
ncbi:hypothetical protein KC349_g209 [Hortaea werneckii]|nr:hypothetical protein KC349_g209 [Hortaea werneckii]